MKPATNVFDQRICVKKDCPAWYENDENPDYGQFCEARLDYPGSIGVKDGTVQYGVLCRLPIGFKIVRSE